MKIRIAKKLLLPLITVLLFVSCQSIWGEVSKNGKTLVPLYSIHLSVDSVKIAVKSNGCTQADDFIVVLDTSKDLTRLSILKTKKDRCRRKPSVIELDLPLDALDFDPESFIKLMNPLVIKDTKF